MDKNKEVLAWSNVLSIISSALLSAGVTYYFMSGGQVRAPPKVFSQLLKYLPNSMLLFGILADMLTYEGVYSIPSFVGFLSIFVNKIFDYFWSGLLTLTGFASSNLNPVAPVDECEVIPLLSASIVPQGLVVTSTIFFYYVLDLIANRGWVDATATIVLLGVLFIGQAVVTPECGKTVGKGIQIFFSIVEGLFIGGFSLGIVSKYFPERLPSSVLPQYPRKSAKDLKPGPNGTLVDDEGRPWTILANGAVIPDTSTPAGRAAFQSTGAPAQATSCSS